MMTYDGFSSICTAVLSTGVAPLADVFLPEGDRQPRRILSSGDTFDRSEVSELLSLGAHKVLLLDSDLPRFSTILREHACNSLAVEPDPKTRLAILSELLRVELETAFASKDMSGIVDRCEYLGNLCRLAFEFDNEISIVDLYGTLHSDSTLASHSANVALVCCLMAKNMDIVAVEQEHIATGALLHDIGMLTVEADICMKNEPLDRSEFQQIQRHPADGFAALLKCPSTTFGQLMMVYQHHERLDGTGYPVGVVADEIHTYAKICAIADVFAALIADRPYRNAEPANLALEEVCRKNEFDAEIVRSCWQTYERVRDN